MSVEIIKAKHRGNIPPHSHPLCVSSWSLICARRGWGGDSGKFHVKLPGLPSLVRSSVSRLYLFLILAASSSGTLNPFSAKYSAGSSNEDSGNLPYLSAASDTPAMNPGTSTEAPFFRLVLEEET